MKQVVISQLSWIRESLWWLFTMVVSLVVLYPAYGYINSSFLWSNIMFIIITITYLRFIVFWKQVPYLQNFWVGLGLFIFNVLVFWQFMNVIQDFLFAIDNYTISAFLTEDVMFESSGTINEIYLYFKKEYILFSTASEMLIIFLGIKILKVMWGNDKKF